MKGAYTSQSGQHIMALGTAQTGHAAFVAWQHSTSTISPVAATVAARAQGASTRRSGGSASHALWASVNVLPITSADLRQRERAVQAQQVVQRIVEEHQLHGLAALVVRRQDALKCGLGRRISLHV